jgi:hypothetical protein
MRSFLDDLELKTGELSKAEPVGGYGKANVMKMFEQQRRRTVRFVNIARLP